MKLYSYFRSSASYRVRTALALKDIDHEYIAVHLLKDGGEQLQPDFAKLNPMKQIPCLVDGENVINQSMAILWYLDRKFPQNPLFPSDPMTLASCLEICELINSGIHPIQNLRVMKYVDEKFSVGAEGKSAWAHHWIDQGFQALEMRLASLAGKFSLGDTLTAADLFLVPQVYNARRFKVDMNQYPTIDRIDQECLQLPAFQKSTPETQPDTPEE